VTARRINSLYGVLNPGVVYNDWSLCNALYANKGVSSTYEMEFIQSEQQSLSRLNFKLYPNPASSEVSIIHNLINLPNTQINISDMTGRLRKSIDVSNYKTPIVIPISDLENGVFCIELSQNGTKLFTDKLIVQ
jgi:hypothetical protein